MDVKKTKNGIVFSSGSFVEIYHYGTDEDIFSDYIRSHGDISELEQEIILLHVKLWKKNFRKK